MDHRETCATVAETEAARGELAEALAAVGVQLPSLRVDTVPYANEPSFPLVDLGRCNAETALALAAALRGRQG
ncbi:hypothetical protein QIS96_34150 [Streptomyces sp. B-S-A6]|uniref:Secreted protein n=1 Tax=Streptomyces cavernicola TaxID=3043613 RepID=A0ABT6SME5_9ACTN|nr:hypothetical protein [Streptomyces sp. B-S-A6]MDI3408847.1 hypothetical protein [Streptomyces sp. B-S-A6]